MAYSFFRSITFDHTKCGSVNSTDFPALVSGTYTYLRTVANGGDVTNANGYDIIFTSDSAGTTPLKWEIERYNAVTGEVVFWVKVPTLSASVDTVIYMFYANAAITTFQGDINGTWNSAFKAVWHYPDGTTLSLADSTSNARNGTNIGSCVAAAGQMDGCFTNFGLGAGDHYVTTSDTGLPSGNGDRTISCWIFKPTSWGDGYIWSLGNFPTANQCFSLSIRNAGTTLLLVDGVNPNPGFTFNVDTWYYISITWTSTGGILYVNASSIGTWTNGSQNTTLIGTFYIGETNPAVFNTPFLGRIDELRISNVVRTPSWITSEYNNQNSPGTFYAVGSATPVGGGGVNVNLGSIRGTLGAVRIH